MPIPADYVLKAGYYRNDTTGQVVKFCSCPGHPWQMSALRAQRDKWTPWPQGAQPKGATNVGKTV